MGRSFAIFYFPTLSWILMWLKYVLHLISYLLLELKACRIYRSSIWPLSTQGKVSCHVHVALNCLPLRICVRLSLLITKMLKKKYRNRRTDEHLSTCIRNSGVYSLQYKKVIDGSEYHPTHKKLTGRSFSLL